MITDLLARLRNQQVKLWVEGNTLRYQAPQGVITEQLLAEIRRGKSEIVEFLRQVERERRYARESIPACPRDGRDIPLSYSQQALWFFERITPGTSVYSIARAARLHGPFDAKAFGRSLSMLAARHEILRTTFLERNGQPVQSIATKIDPPLHQRDLTRWPSAERETRLLASLSQEAARPFLLDQAPPWRLLLYCLDVEEHALLFVVHHILADAWANEIFVQELFGIYEGFRRGEAVSLPEPPIQFADYAIWQRQQLEQPEYAGPLLAYWRERVLDISLDLPTDHPRPPVQSYQGGLVPIALPTELSARLKKLAGQENVTLFMVLFAAFNILLHRHSGQATINVGTIAANRSRQELEGLLGLVMNTLVLTTDLSGGPSFRQLLARVRETTLGAFAHQDLPFDRLIEEIQPARDPGRTPLFQAMFILQAPAPAQSLLSGLILEPIELAQIASPFDLRLILQEKGERIAGHLDYCAALFDDLTASRLTEHLGILLQGAAADPDCPIGLLPLMAGAERRRILEDFNQTSAAFPADLTVTEIFEAQATAHPEATAAIFGEESLTYGQLNARANQLARHLKSLGVGPDVPVGICLERSLEMVVGILGILKAGGAYVPFDPDYPAERLHHMLTDAGVPVLLTAERLRPRLPVMTAAMVRLDGDWDRISGGDSANLPQEAGEDNLAYVIFTSGSTGRPKGAMNTHRGLRNHKQWMQAVYGLAPQDRVLQKTPFSFDVSIWEFFWPLITGAGLVLAKPGGHRDPDYLIDTIISRGITVIHFVPSMLQAFLNARRVEECRSLRMVFCSGEALSLDLQRRFAERLPLPLHNVYGPAECADVATAWTCTGAEERTVPIGRPIANVRIYILDSQLNPAPIGVFGEICVGGTGVGRGYINNPILSAERFLSDPFRQSPGAMMYRTGDLGRFRPDGVIEYQGRTDLQVKIRGQRVELGEIEAILAGAPGIREAAAAVKERAGGDKYLAAYLVTDSGKAIDRGGLRAFLAGKLPEHMVPRAFVFLSALPLNPNGKLDRKALPEPDPAAESSAARDFEAPRTEAERKLAAIWRDVLGLDRIDVRDNFFEAGGHSLLLIRVQSRMREAFRCDFPIAELINRPVFAEMAGYAEQTGREESDPEAGRLFVEPIEATPRQERYRLSGSQRRMYVSSQMEKRSTANNIVEVLMMRGAIDRDRLESALSRLIERHESLRASFAMVDGEPVQFVHDRVDFHLAYREIANERARINEAIREFIRPHNLARAPLFHLQLIRLAGEEPLHLLFTDLHHIIADGVSVAVLVEELGALYAGKELPPPRLQYRDFVAWQERLLATAALRRQREYWLNRFQGEIPILNLPTDYPRPAVAGFTGASIRFRIEEERTRELRALIQESGVTLYHLLLAVYNVLLAKYTGQDDIIVGSPVAGRRHPNLDRIIGVFINTLAMRNRPEPGKTFRQLLAEVKETGLQALENQDYPFDRLVEELNLRRDLGRNPLVQAILVLQNTGVKPLDLDGLEIDTHPFDHESTQFEQAVYVTEKSGGLEFEITYSDLLFARESVERFAGHWQRLLDQVVHRPEARLGELEIVEQGEKEQIIFGFNRTARDRGEDETIAARFEAQAERIPEAVAVRGREDELTYRELNELANRLADRLRRLGVKPGSIVGLLARRSPAMIAGLLAILKAGGAYLPLDPDYPPERLAFMLADSSAAVLLSERESVKEVAFAGTICHLDGEEIETEEGVNLPLQARGGDLAYVIYTSGSTGQPKGVMIEHQSVVNFVDGTMERIRFFPEDTLLCLTTVSFDIFVLETLAPLCLGLRVVLADEAVQRDPAAIISLIRQEGISLLQVTPSRLQQLLWSEKGDRSWLNGLRVLMIGGEPFPGHLLPELKGCPAEIYNMYGPTETTVWSTIEAVDPGGAGERARPVGIGYPIANTRLYVLGESLEILPVGVPGELYIAGDGLSRGYLNRPELTVERFLDNPHLPGERMYRTGDRVRWRADGSLEHLGRTDFQVKIRGHRVELGEIETALVGAVGVKEAAVVVRETANGQKTLEAYYAADVPLDAEQLRPIISEKLPDHMIPARFIRMEKLPVTSNGKIDRRALLRLAPPALEVSTADKARERPASELEEKLVGIWQRVLEAEEIGVNDNFFELGGNSLLSIKLEVELEKAGFALGGPDLFRNQTIRQMAAAMAANGVEAEERGKVSRETASPAGKEEDTTAVQNPDPAGRSPRRRMLSRIEPFNEIFYRNCFYNSAFPVLQSLQRSPLPFLINDVAVFAYEREPGLSINYLPNRPAEQIVVQQGVGLETHTVLPDLLDLVHRAIDRDRPLIVWVDCYYESIREDTYQKLHWPHTWLIIGYDDELEQCQIIEHRHRDNLSYEKRLLSYGEVIASYQGYLDNFRPDPHFVTCYEFYQDPALEAGEDNSPAGDWRKTYAKNISAKLEKISAGLAALSRFIDDFREIAADPEILARRAEKMLSGLNEVINSKEVEKYKLTRIESPEAAIDLLEETMESWRYVRSVLAKYVFSGVHKPDDFRAGGEKLERVLGLEGELARCLAEDA